MADPDLASEAELAAAMRKLLDGTWTLVARAPSLGSQFFQINKGKQCLAQGYDNLPRILELAIEADEIYQ